MKRSKRAVGGGILLASSVANAPPWLLQDSTNPEMGWPTLLWWLVGTCVVAAAGGWWTNGTPGERWRLAAGSAFAGVHIVVLLRIVIDLAADPTSHNLAPFEFLAAALPAGAGASLGSVLGVLGKWK